MVLNRKAELDTITIILFAFIIVIIGAITASVISQQASIDTNPTVVTDEALSISSLRIAGNNINASLNVTLKNLGLKSEGGWVTSSVVIKNASGTTLAGNYTVDYTNQKISFLNNTFTVTGGGAGNNTLASYEYYPLSYLTQSFGRRILYNILPGLYVLTILVGIIGLVTIVLRRFQK